MLIQVRFFFCPFITVNNPTCFHIVKENRNGKNYTIVGNFPFSQRLSQLLCCTCDWSHCSAGVKRDFGCGLRLNGKMLCTYIALFWSYRPLGALYTTSHIHRFTRAFIRHFPYAYDTFLSLTHKHTTHHWHIGVQKHA